MRRLLDTSMPNPKRLREDDCRSLGHRSGTGQDSLAD